MALRAPLTHVFRAALIALTLGAGSPSNPVLAGEAYTLGVFPHLPPRELEKVYAPMAADLAEALGRPVHFRSSSTYQKFMKKLDQQAFEIVFVQPFDYVRIADRFGYRPLATRGEPLRAIFTVEPDGPIEDIEDLRGKTVALPPKVAAVSYLVKGHLAKLGIDDVHYKYQRSHVSCMQQVLIGSAAACGTAAPALRFFEHRMDTQLDVVAKTQPIPHTLFAVSPRVPAAEQKLVRDRIVSWADSEAGRKLLSRGKLTPFKRIDDSDYDIVREMLQHQ